MNGDWMHRRLAIGALVLAIGGALPWRARTRSKSGSTANLDVEDLARAIERQSDHVSAPELGAWITARKPGLRIIDLRSQPEFDKDHIPTAERIPLERLVQTRFATDDTVVLYSQSGAHAGQAWVFLRALGYEHVYFLRGGLDEWHQAATSSGRMFVC